MADVVARYPRGNPLSIDANADEIIDLYEWHANDYIADRRRVRWSESALLRLKLADAVQAASAISINADALVTHDRDLSRLRTLRVLP